MRPGRRRGGGVLFQDSQELVVKGCENNTEAQAVREIVNRGINGTVKRALKPTPTLKPLHKGMFECGTTHCSARPLCVCVCVCVCV